MGRHEEWVLPYEYPSYQQKNWVVTRCKIFVCILSFIHDIFVFSIRGTLFCYPQIHCYFLTSQCFAGYVLLGCECVLSSKKLVMFCRNQLPSFSGYKASCTENSYFSTLILIPFCYICHVIETWKWLAMDITREISSGILEVFTPSWRAIGLFLSLASTWQRCPFQDHELSTV
jgi:hypothetical protein